MNVVDHPSNPRRSSQPPQANRMVALRTLGCFLAGCSVVGFALLCARSNLDDPFIYARYARNILRFGEPVWNQGGPWVEGFSSIAWTGVYVLGAALSAPVPGFARVAGLLCVALLLTLLLRDLVRGRSTPAYLLAATLIATSYDLGYHATTGMDHILWALAVWGYLRWLSNTNHLTTAHGLVAAGGFLLRPEGFLLFVPLFVRYWRTVSATGAIRLRRTLVQPPLLVGLGAYLALSTLRFALFDRWLPNAAAAKHFGAPWLRVGTGVRYLNDGLNLYALLPLLLVLIAGATNARSDRPADRLNSVSLWFVAANLAFIVVAGGDDVSAFGTTRLFVPLVAPLTWLAVDAFDRLTHEHRLLPTILFCMVVFASRYSHALDLLRSSTEATTLTSIQSLLTDWTSGFTKTWRSAHSERFLAVSARDATIAVPWAGEVPYNTDLRHIDLLGLNDPKIADVPIVDGIVDGRYDVDYVLQLRPDYICDNFDLSVPLENAGRLTNQELYAMGAFKHGQRELVRHPDLQLAYEIDPKLSAIRGTCFRLKRPESHGGPSTIPGRD